MIVLNSIMLAVLVSAQIYARKIFAIGRNIHGTDMRREFWSVNWQVIRCNQRKLKLAYVLSRKIQIHYNVIIVM